MNEPEFEDYYAAIMREVPDHPNTEDLHYFRYKAVDELGKAIQENGQSNALLLDACNSIGDYVMARMRWLNDFGPRP